MELGGGRRVKLKDVAYLLPAISLSSLNKLRALKYRERTQGGE